MGYVLHFYILDSKYPKLILSENSSDKPVLTF